MTLDRAVRRIAASVSLSPFVSLLALAALLFAVFAFHSEAAGHAMHTPVSAASASAGPEAAVMAMAAVVAEPAVALISSDNRERMVDCALLAMTCVLLLALVAMVFLTRLPTLRRRLLDAGSVALASWRRIDLPVHRPNLTLLSISRV